MNKRGLELSINFIVMLIIAIAVFGMTLTMAYKLFRGSTDMTVKIDEQTEMRMEALLDDGGMLVIPFEKKTIRRGDMGVFGVGVLNVVGIRTEEPFELQIRQLKGFEEDGTEIANPGTHVELLYNMNTITVKNNEKHKFAIGASVQKSAPSGTYIIDFVVMYDSDGDYILDKEYGRDLNKIYVIVP